MRGREEWRGGEGSAVKGRLGRGGVISNNTQQLFAIQRLLDHCYPCCTGDAASWSQLPVGGSGE